MKRKIFAVTFGLMIGVTGGVSAVRATAEATEYNYLTETYMAENAIVGEPTVISRLTNEGMLDKLEGVVPSNLIMTLDKDGNVVGTDGDVIGSFVDIYKNNVDSFVLPVVEINSEEAATAFVDIWNNQTKIMDMAVMSADATLLKSVRDNVPQIRGIYDCSDKTFTGASDWQDAVQTANVSKANVVVLSQSQTTLGSVEYFQYRFKTVWTEMDEEMTDFDIKSMVSTGTYGIIANEYKKVYNAYEDYAENSIARVSANIAHRGLPSTMTENTVEGALGAYEGGATHIEIDGHLSKDGHVVIMHDATIDRTTNGTGAVASMTLAEIQQYKVVQKSGGNIIREDPIPTAEDVFKAFEDKDIVIVFEIKTGDVNILPAIRTLIEKYNFWDKIVFISFNNTIVEKAYEVLPEVPTASLSGFIESDFMENMQYRNSINTISDASIGDLTVNKNYYEVVLKDRGYMSFAWTYGYAQDCVFAMRKGVFGLTNNSADMFGTTYVAKAYGADDMVMKKEDIVKDAEIAIKTETYSGEVTDNTGKIFAVRDCGTYAEVIVCYEEIEYTMYSTAFKITYEVEKKGFALNCNSFAGVGSLISVSTIAAAILLKKKEK